MLLILIKHVENPTKNSMVTKLINLRKTQNTPHIYEAKINAFLNPKQQVNKNEVPKLIEYYSLTYKQVDKFDALLGHLSWMYKTEKHYYIYLINCVKIALVNAWVLEMYYNNTFCEGDGEEDLKTFTSNVANYLLQSK